MGGENAAFVALGRLKVLSRSPNKTLSSSHALAPHPTIVESTVEREGEWSEGGKSGSQLNRFAESMDQADKSDVLDLANPTP